MSGIPTTPTSHPSPACLRSSQGTGSREGSGRTKEETIVHTRPTCHRRDNTVTYWSVYDQAWIRRAHAVPAAELAALCYADRQRVIRTLELEEV